MPSSPPCMCMSFRWLRLEEILLRSVIPARRGNVLSVSHVQKTQRRERVVFSGLECHGSADEWCPLGRYFCPPVWYPPGMCRFVSTSSAATVFGSGVLERILAKERSSCVARHSLHSRAYRARDIQSYPNKSYAALRARPPASTGRRPLRPLEGRVRVTAAVLSGSTPLALPPGKL